MNNIAKFDVIISGLGPVGAVTANLLAQYGLTVAVFERDFEIYNLGPRAIAIDAEAMMVFGMMGLDDWLDSHVVKPCIGVRTGVPPNGVTLLSVKPERHSLYGHERIAFFNQPCLEKTLRENLEQYSNVKMYLGHEVVSDMTEGGDVKVKVRKCTKNVTETYLCKFFLVCEGGRSATRKRHGFKFHGSSFKQKWLVLDTVTFDKDVKQTLRDMWYVSNRHSTMALVPLPGDTQRFEFLLTDDTDCQKIVEIDEAASLIRDIGVDPKKLYFKRRIVYTFHARQIEHWYDGNVVFLGDAAHCMPPFAGQGLCNGIRDAANLAWKISLAIKGNLKKSNELLEPAQNGNLSRRLKGPSDDKPLCDRGQLLKSFERERFEDVEEMTQRSIYIGWLMMIRNPFILLLRNLLLLFCHVIGLGRRIIEKPTLQFREGIFDASCSSSGTLFIRPQVHVTHLQKTVPLDKVLGSGFALICYNVTPRISTVVQSTILKPLNFTVIEVSVKKSLSPQNCVDTCTRDENTHRSSRHTCLCVSDVNGELRKWFRRNGCNVAIIRPDRFVYSCGCEVNLAQMLEDLRRLLSGQRPLRTNQMTPIKWHLLKTLTGVILLTYILYFFLIS